MLGPFQMSRRARRRLQCVVGALALFTWLFMATAEICPSLHAWLHGGTIPDDDDCPIMAMATSHVDPGVCTIEPVLPVAFIGITPPPKIIAFVPSERILPNERAPPLPCA